MFVDIDLEAVPFWSQFDLSLMPHMFRRDVTITRCTGGRLPAVVGYGAGASHHGVPHEQ